MAATSAAGVEPAAGSRVSAGWVHAESKARSRVLAYLIWTPPGSIMADSAAPDHPCREAGNG